jgi:hypothetical protein
MTPPHNMTALTSGDQPDGVDRRAGISTKMKHDWNRRARTHTQFWIATGHHDTDEAFIQTKGVGSLFEVDCALPAGRPVWMRKRLPTPFLLCPAHIQEMTTHHLKRKFAEESLHSEAA